MKTNNIVLMAIILLWSIAAISQEVKPTYFKVVTMKIGDENYDHIPKSNDIVLVFSEKNGISHFTNWWKNENSASSGRILSYETGSIPGNITNLTKEDQVAFKFVWEYKNTYDNESGIADVEFVTKVLDEMIVFVCVIKPRNNKSQTQLQGFLVTD